MLIVAHGSGIDDIAFVALPVLVFVVLQWLNRRRARSHASEQENGGPETNDFSGPDRGR